MLALIDPVLSNFIMQENHLGKLMVIQLLGPSLRDSDVVCLGWAPGIYFFNKLSRLV